MTDIELTTLSTIAWFVLTSALFFALARWSAGNGSWTILPGLVDGLRDWTSDESRPPANSSRGGDGVVAEIEELRPAPAPPPTRPVRRRRETVTGGAALDDPGAGFVHEKRT
jgi:hypothetical protein